MPLRSLVLTAFALLAFAGNSLLCRAALRGSAIDPASFTAIRLVSGALTLWGLARKPLPLLLQSGTQPGAGALLVYCAAFSFAYVALPASVGALILFGSVQVTMLVGAYLGRERPSALGWLGMALAMGGLIALQVPGVEMPDPSASLLMAIAGIAWGIYSLLGRSSARPAAEATAANFLLAAPLGIMLFVARWQQGRLAYSLEGIGLALASGALTSGVGYAIWYAVLPKLAAAQAAVAQLLVPILALVLGAVLLSEQITVRLLVCGTVVLAGVALSLVQPRAAR